MDQGAESDGGELSAAPELNPLDVLKSARVEMSIREDRENLKVLSEFVRAAWRVVEPEVPYMHNWHIDVVCEHLEACSRGEIDRLQIWVPRASMKSRLVSVLWPAWEWTFKPNMRYFSASYDLRLAGRLAADARNLMMSEWYQQRWGDQFNFTREGERYYANSRGGTRLATAPGSSGIGEHANRVIIDDIINALEAEADSGVLLAQANDWYDATIPGTRLTECAEVIIMQRLHENDIAAHVLELAEWTVVCLPERYEAKHPFVYPEDPRREGQLLWPARRDEKASLAMARALKSFRAAGQMQQRPSAREGEILKREWWRFYDPRWRGDPAKLPRFTQIVVSVDTPLKDKESNDLVAVQCYGVVGADRYLLDLDKGHMNYHKAKRRVKEMAIEHRRLWPRVPHYLLIENAGYGVEMILDLKRELTGVIKIPPGEDGRKTMRAESASDALESGNVFLPGYGPPWQPALDEGRCPADVVDFVDSCARFPNATHDDDVDAWSQCMNWLRGRASAPLRTSSALRNAPSALGRRIAGRSRSGQARLS